MKRGEERYLTQKREIVAVYTKRVDCFERQRLFCIKRVDLSGCEKGGFFF